ncbi:MAG TPA: hypothetical protein VJP77_09480 [Planctomycetota bacterium]|nr:hypothetical protein [Planctomycetota bacterium]
MRSSISTPSPPATLADAGLLVHAQSFFPLLPGLVDPAAADATGPVSLVLGF